MSTLTGICTSRTPTRTESCGNGWVERDIYKTGLFEEAVGVDYLQPLIDDAQHQANISNLPFRYYQLDINTGIFPEKDFDLVVNHAGFHHVAFINKVLKAVCEVMTPDGYFVNYDYVGPHRNQYPYEQWSEVFLLNESLPSEVRQALMYPHQPTMLVTDPTEAIHSELIIEATARYFNLVEHKKVGGGLAYPLLTFNNNMRVASQELQNEWIRFILKEDLRFLQDHPHLSLFDYFVGTPNKEIIRDWEKMAHFDQIEQKREKESSLSNGVYYPNTLLQDLYLKIANLGSNNDHLRAELDSFYSRSKRFLMKLYKGLP